MKLPRLTGIATLLVGVLSAQQVPEDPVLRARADRARAQGIAEEDLPPVPRGVIEPPPLPPPETHPKDLRRAQKGHTVRASRKKGKLTKAPAGQRKVPTRKGRRR